MKPQQSFLLVMASLLALFGLALLQPPATAGAKAGPQGASSSTAASSSGSQANADPMPVDEIIRRFAQHESDFKLARDNYTYTQDVLVEDVAPRSGEYHLVSDIVFTPQGKRYEQVTFAPQSTLQDFSLSPEDMK